MKRKITIEVQMQCDKRRTKAMKIAATTYGVVSVEIGGPERDQLVVIGEDVDSANLTRSLRKKLCHARILKVEEVKEKEEEKEEEKEPPKPCCEPLPFCHQYAPYPMYCEVASDPYPSGCSIM